MSFWKGKRVFITGHTGFKGSWLSLWLQYLGAEVKGYSLSIPTKPSLFEIAQVSEKMFSEEGDIRDFSKLCKSLSEFRPEIVFHMAAQPLVRFSYEDPVDTYSTNVMGTVNILEAVRQVGGVKAVVNITSDKCYENREWVWGYRESDPMGGYDPYSNSKGCAELVAASYRQSFFSKETYGQHGCAIASVRAGNVIGGGDWAEDRLVPDILEAFAEGRSVEIRSPHALRPWQHVLEPLSGYLLLAERLYKEGMEFAEAWNFGPREEDTQPVQWLVETLSDRWGVGADWSLNDGEHPHEAHYLKLDCSKAKMRLGWQSVWDLEETLSRIVAWHKNWLAYGAVKQHTLEEIKEYMAVRSGKEHV